MIKFRNGQIFDDKGILRELQRKREEIAAKLNLGSKSDFKFLKDNRLIKEEDPERKVCDKDYSLRGNLVCVKFFKNGYKSYCHKGMPSVITFYDNPFSVIRSIEFKENKTALGGIFSDERIFKVNFKPNGDVCAIYFVERDKNGKILDNTFNRISYYKNGNVEVDFIDHGIRRVKRLYIKNENNEYVMSNENEPTEMTYSRYGAIIERKYYLNDKFITCDPAVWDVKDKIKDKSIMKSINKRTKISTLEAIRELMNIYNSDDKDAINKINARIVILKLCR